DLNDKLDEYNKNELKPKLNEIKIKKKELGDKKKKNKEDKTLLEEIKAEELKLKKEEKELKEAFEKNKKENYTEPYSKFATLTTSLKYYEVLNNIELVLHIRADEKVLKDIEENIYNLKSIGRSEDFVDVKEVKVVELIDELEELITSEYSAYIQSDLVKNEIVFPKIREGKSYSGTKYRLNKNYEIVNKKRVFNKEKVLYISEYKAGETEKVEKNLFFDIEEKKKYIVNFV
ncbi:MAG: CRISPR-associated protein Cas5, partial [Clostridium sp.]